MAIFVTALLINSACVFALFGHDKNLESLINEEDWGFISDDYEPLSEVTGP